MIKKKKDVGALNLIRFKSCIFFLNYTLMFIRLRGTRLVTVFGFLNTILGQFQPILFCKKENSNFIFLVLAASSTIYKFCFVFRINFHKCVVNNFC